MQHISIYWPVLQEQYLHLWGSSSDEGLLQLQQPWLLSVPTGNYSELHETPKGAAAPSPIHILMQLYFKDKVGNKHFQLSDP